VVTDNLKHSLTEVLVDAAKTPSVLVGAAKTPSDGNRIIHPPPSEEQYSLQTLRTTNPGERKDIHICILAGSTKRTSKNLNSIVH
jgi:hypothetical protein